MSIDYSGYLNRKEGVLKTWAKRWAELQDGILHFYKDKGMPETGQLSIKTASSVQEVSKGKNRNRFKVVENGKTYMFSADTELSMNDWVRVLDRARQGLSPDPPETEIVATADNYKRPVRKTRRGEQELQKTEE